MLSNICKYRTVPNNPMPSCSLYCVVVVVQIVTRLCRFVSKSVAVERNRLSIWRLRYRVNRSLVGLSWVNPCLVVYDSKTDLHRSCCHSSKQDGSVSSGTWCGWATRKTRSEPYIRRFAGCPRTGDAVQDVHVTPGYGPWKQTFSRSTTDSTQHGDLPRIENDGDNSWKRLHSSQELARDDDDDDWVVCSVVVIRYCCYVILC